MGSAWLANGHWPPTAACPRALPKPPSARGRPPSSRPTRRSSSRSLPRGGCRAWWERRGATCEPSHSHGLTPVSGFPTPSAVWREVYSGAHVSLLADGLGWPRMASDGLGWPRMALSAMRLTRSLLPSLSLACMHTLTTAPHFPTGHPIPVALSLFGFHRFHRYIRACVHVLILRLCTLVPASLGSVLSL